MDSRTGVYSVCCLLRSVQDNFVWGLIGIYGPNDDTLRGWFIGGVGEFLIFVGCPLVLRGDFNVVRFPSERSTGGRLTPTMCEFSTFINLCNLVNPL